MSKKESISHCATCPIRHLSIFSGLSTAEIESLDVPVIKIVYEPGEIFYHENGKIQAAFTIYTGVVKLIRSLRNGRNQIVRLLTTGDIFGFEGLIEARYHHSAVAISQTKVCRLSVPELTTLCRYHGSVREALTQRWSTALRQAEELVMEMGSKKAGERLAAFLLHWCRHRDINDWTPLPLTRQEFGELLGLTVETVSRFLAEWKREGIIAERSGNIRIVQEAALRARAEGVRLE